MDCKFLLELFVLHGKKANIFFIYVKKKKEKYHKFLLNFVTNVNILPEL